MLRKALLASVFTLPYTLPCIPAAAQNVTCATRAPGDSTNACASTAFVNSEIGHNIPLPLSIANGGTGTSAPTFTAGANIIITGTFPFYTISSSGGAGTGVVGSGLTNEFAYYPSNGTSVIGLGLSSLLLGPNQNNVVALGADPTGGSNSTAAFTAAATNVGTGSGSIFVPCGRYVVTGSALVETVASGKNLTFIGGGPECTVIVVSTGNGPHFTLADHTSNIHVRDLTIATQAVKNGTGLTIDQTTPNASPNLGSNMDITNVTIRGDDWTGAQADEFATALQIGPGTTSNVNVTNLIVFSALAEDANGVVVEGSPSTSQYGVVFNFQGCSFSFLENGFIYDSYVQGVTFNQSNFTGVGAGIISSGTGLLNELTMTNSQLAFTHFGIFSQSSSPITSMMISTTLFTALANNSNAISGLLEAATISANIFDASNTLTGVFGIVTNNGSFGINVTGNTFFQIQQGVDFQAGTTDSGTGSNTWHNVSVKTTPSVTTGSITIGGGGP